MKLLEALNTAKETDLEEIQGLITDKESEIDAIKAVHRILVAKFHGKPVRGKRSAAGAASANGDAPTSAISLRRAGCLKLLLASGPTGPASICKTLDIPNGGSISACLNHPWFQKTGGSAGDPLRVSLTALGQSAAKALVAGHKVDELDEGD